MAIHLSKRLRRKRQRCSSQLIMRKEYYKTKKPEEPDHYFQQMKQLAIAGYFCSEKRKKRSASLHAGSGKFVGDLEYKKGEKHLQG